MLVLKKTASDLIVAVTFRSIAAHIDKIIAIVIKKRQFTNIFTDNNFNPHPLSPPCPMLSRNFQVPEGLEGRASARALCKSQAKKSKFSPLRNSTDYVILVTPVISLTLIQSSQSSARSHHDSSKSQLITTNCYPGGYQGKYQGGYQGVIFTVRLSRRLVRAPIAITMRTARALIVTDSSPIPGLSDLI